MGLFDMFESKKKCSAELADVMDKMVFVGFPGGPRQIEQETAKLRAICGGLTKEESGRLLLGAKALFFMSEDKSEPAITASILQETDGRLTEDEARLVYEFLTNPSRASAWARG